MFGLSTLRLVLIGGVVAAVLGGLAWIYAEGKSDGKATVERANSKATGAQNDERNKVNEDIRNTDAAAVCRELGGVQCDRPR